MANFRYFADTAERTVSFKSVDHRRDGAYGYDYETRQWIKTTRKVVLKSNPSRHECDARCLNASGKTMNCDCACGGANHGRGAIQCQ